MHKQKGFTLIELLIVIAIVTVLVGGLIFAIDPVALAAKGRDARRLQDMDELNKAISLALSEGEITLTATGNCNVCSSGSGSQAVNGTGYIKFTLPDGRTGLSKFIKSLPLDPTNRNELVYTFASNTTNYELNAVLESLDNAAKMSTDGGSSPDVYEIGTALNIL